MNTMHDTDITFVLTTANASLGREKVGDPGRKIDPGRKN
jgi:hypothetical protein